MTHNNSRVILTIETFREMSKQSAIMECQLGADPEFAWKDYENSSRFYDIAVKKWYSFDKPSDVLMVDFVTSTAYSIDNLLREWIEEEREVA